MLLKTLRTCFYLNLAFWLPIVAMAEGDPLTLNAAGWLQYGQIGNSTLTDTTKDINGKSITATGAQIGVTKIVSENLIIKAGIGVISMHALSSSLSGINAYAPMDRVPYVSEANFKYSFWNEDESALFLRGGLLPFDYSNDNRNLGLYLLRGPVYPGIINSGFETKEVLPIANLLALHLHHESKGFYQDLIISSETEQTPFFDISPALIIGFKKEGLFDVSTGINAYHLIPIDDEVTNPTKGDVFFLDTARDSSGTALIDSVFNYSGDTTFISYQGIKLMFRASFDIKGLIGDMGFLGVNDLKLYGEVAVIGLNEDKVHVELYGKLDKRMPMMLGFNIPVLGFLDHLTLEIEYYKAEFRDNLNGYNNSNTPTTPMPYKDKFEWLNKDDFKWSVHGEKVIKDHIKISFQVANDHYRPGIFKGYGDTYPRHRQTVMQRSPNSWKIFSADWYWMTKVAYFF